MPSDGGPTPPCGQSESAADFNHVPGVPRCSGDAKPDQPDVSLAESSCLFPRTSPISVASSPQAGSSEATIQPSSRSFTMSSIPTPVARQRGGNGPRPRDSIRCSACPKMYADHHKLRRHKAAAHEGVRVYQKCDVCTALVAGDRSHLSQHKARHDKHKRYHCYLCPFKTQQAGNLKTHHDSKHQGKRPYMCSICGYSGKLRQHLSRHMLSMHGGT